jgi:predicted  nucleic acid-binding Zn-ribbon protein
VDVTVQRIAVAQQRFENAAGSLGAQVSRLDTRERQRAEYYVRVPPERLDALMDSAAVLGDVASRTVSAQDVTEQVVDVEARLSVMRASRDRLKQLMERGTSVTDVIAVERELARVQSEIESLEARLAALEGSIARSDLTVSVEQRHVLGPLGVVAVGAGKALGKLFVWR